MYYGPSDEEDLRQLVYRVARIADKILRGANPADIPVEMPKHYETGINLKVARALGLTISQSVLLRSDTVIN